MRRKKFKRQWEKPYTKKKSKKHLPLEPIYTCMYILTHARCPPSTRHSSHIPTPEEGRRTHRPRASAAAARIINADASPPSVSLTTFSAIERISNRSAMISRSCCSARVWSAFSRSLFFCRSSDISSLR